MFKLQFKIRTLLILTLLVAISLPTAMSHYDDIAGYLFFTKPKVEDVIPILVSRVPPSSAKEISIRPLGNPNLNVKLPQSDLR